jgi:ABC-type Mn2+/Zn2+ transport system ATPase subunit
MLQIEELAVNYGKRNDGPVLKGVDIQLNNEKAVVVGPNRSGESTLFKAVLGLVKIEEGAVKVFEIDEGKERNDLRVSTNLADVYRLAYLKIQDILIIFAELEGEAPEEALFRFS